jgi:hypothetical protein
MNQQTNGELGRSGDYNPIKIERGPTYGFSGEADIRSLGNPIELTSDMEVKPKYTGVNPPALGLFGGGRTTDLASIVAVEPVPNQEPVEMNYGASLVRDNVGGFFKDLHIAYSSMANMGKEILHGKLPSTQSAILKEDKAPSKDLYQRIEETLWKVQDLLRGR